MTHASPDLDAATIPPFSTLDGIEGVYADDERFVDLWSHYHAIRVNTNTRLVRGRLRAFRWQLDNVRPRGDAALVAAAEAGIAACEAELAELAVKREALEKARQADWYAPKAWHWE